MKCNEVLVAAMLLAITSVRAGPAPMGSQKRGDPQYSPFAQCIRQKYSNYPTEGTPNPKDIRQCLDGVQHKAKRDDEMLVYEPDEKNPIERRGIIDTVTTLGKQLFLDKKPYCDGDRVHDNFVWVEDIRARSNDVCKGLRAQIDSNGLTRDGGVGKIVELMTNGHDKQGHQLKDNRKVTATYLLTFLPPVNMAVKEIKELAAGVYDLCNDGIERIATKGEGCSQDIKYFRPSKAKTYHSDGAIGGYLRMYLGGNDDDSRVVDLSVDFTNDG